jgi:phosphoribosylanthranilate isomerase
MSAVPKVKICGLTSESDVAMAVAAGADALGFLVGLDYESEDELEPARARELVRQVPVFVTPVLVTHRTELDAILRLCDAVPAAHVQLHGPASLDDVPALRRAFPHLKVIKAVHVVDRASIDAARAAAAVVDAVILDTRAGTRLGGTGKTHDWAISRAICDAIRPTPVILAGGLRPDNVAAAIRQVRPFAVDVNSGVSVARGVKSHELVTRFVAVSKATPTLDAADSVSTPSGPGGRRGPP